MSKFLRTAVKKSVRSGISAFVVRYPQRRILLIARESEPNKGQFCFPGGTHEFGETISDATMREVHEETGYLVKPATSSKKHISPYIEQIFPCEKSTSSWVINCGLYESYAKKQAMEQDIYWEWFATSKDDKECRHISELEESELIPCFWRVYEHFMEYDSKL